MKYIFIILLSITVISCGKKQETVVENKDTINQNRMPPVTKEKPDDKTIEQINPEVKKDSGSGNNLKPVSMKWEFKRVGTGEYDEPINIVYLVVNDKKTEIAKIEFSFSETNKESYKDLNIPANALTSCRGWWAGAGIDYWVIRNGNELTVMSKEIGETTNENGEPGDYEEKPIKVKSINIE